MGSPVKLVAIAKRKRRLAKLGYRRQILAISTVAEFTTLKPMEPLGAANDHAPGSPPPSWLGRSGDFG